MAKSRMSKLIDRYIVRDGKNFRLKDIDPGDTGGFKTDKSAAEGILKEGVDAAVRPPGEALRAGSLGRAARVPGHGRRRQGRRDQARHVRDQPAGLPRVLLQGAARTRSSTTTSCGETWSACRSAAGSGSSIAPTTRKCWSCACIPELLSKQQLPEQLVTQAHLEGALRGHQRLRALSRAQRLRDPQVLPARLQEGAGASASSKRLDEPDKQWKFSLGDLHERERWKDYQDAYEDTIRHTATPHAPWVVVPANKKWFARWVVAATVIDALDELNLAYPKVTPAKRVELQKGRRLLQAAARKS